MVGSTVLAFTRVRIALGLLVAIGALAAASASPAAAAQAPKWVVTSYTSPTNLTPGGTGEVILVAVNVGGAATDGSEIAIKDTLPSGLKATSISGYDTYADGPVVFSFFVKPEAAMSCTSPPELTCSRSAEVQPGDQLFVTINVEVDPEAPASGVNQASVSGGGAPSAPTTRISTAVPAAAAIHRASPPP